MRQIVIETKHNGRTQIGYVRPADVLWPQYVEAAEGYRQPNEKLVAVDIGECEIQMSFIVINEETK